MLQMSIDLPSSLLSPGALLQPYEDFNVWNLSKSEDMVKFHVSSVNHQLQQAYYGFGAALALNRTVVFPEVRSGCQVGSADTCWQSQLSVFQLVCKPSAKRIV